MTRHRQRRRSRKGTKKSPDTISSEPRDAMVLADRLRCSMLVAAVELTGWDASRCARAATIWLWHGAVNSSENSQQLTDWYTFTHVAARESLFYARCGWSRGAMPMPLRLLLAVFSRATWEVARELAVHHRPLPSGDDLARLLRRQHRQLDVGHRRPMMIGFWIARRARPGARWRCSWRWK